MADTQVLVLRLPKQEGNFRFCMAEVSPDDVRQWEQRLSHCVPGALSSDIRGAFSAPLTLPEVMEKLQSRDFQVLDYPAC